MRSLSFSASFLLIMLFSVIAVADEPIKLLFNKWARDEFLSWVVTPYLDEIVRVTEGRVIYEFTGSSLAPASRQYDMVAKRVADMSFVDISDLREEVPSMQLLSLPLISSTTNTTAISMALWRTYEKKFQHADEFSRARALAFFAFPADHILSRDTQILELDHLRGMKFMTQPGVYTGLMDALGASVVPVPVVRSYEMVSRGVVDGILLNFSALRRFRLIDHMHHILYFPGGLSQGAAAIVINNDAWDEISSQDQQAILDISGEHYARRWTGDMAIDSDLVFQEMQRLDRVTFADEAMIESIHATGIVKKMNSEWIESVSALGIDGQGAIDYYQEQLTLALDEVESAAGARINSRPGN